MASTDVSKAIGFAVLSPKDTAVSKAVSYAVLLELSDARLTQSYSEVLRSGDPNSDLYLTQNHVEVLRSGDPNADLYLTQVIVEVMRLAPKNKVPQTFVMVVTS